MRVLHVDTGPEMRGGQWQVLLLVQRLIHRGVDCMLLARGPLLEKAREQGIAAEESGIAAARRLSRAADVIHAHDARSHTWCCTRHPLVVARRVAFPVKPGTLSRWKYAQADRFIAVSRFVANRLAEAGVPQEKIRVVYDGSPTLQPAPPSDRIVAPASADPMKGSQMLRESGLPVTFSSDLARDVPGAAAFVYLSHEEGLGSAVLLAQSCGVPVIASRVGGLPELVEHEVTGLLVPNEASQVRAAVERLNAEPALRTRIAAQARRRFEELFTVDRMVDATLAVYGEVAAR